MRHHQCRHRPVPVTVRSGGCADEAEAADATRSPGSDEACRAVNSRAPSAHHPRAPNRRASSIFAVVAAAPLLLFRAPRPHAAPAVHRLHRGGRPRVRWKTRDPVDRRQRPGADQRRAPMPVGRPGRRSRSLVLRPCRCGDVAARTASPLTDPAENADRKKTVVEPATTAPPRCASKRRRHREHRRSSTGETRASLASPDRGRLVPAGLACTIGGEVSRSGVAGARNIDHPAPPPCAGVRHAS